MASLLDLYDREDPLLPPPRTPATPPDWWSEQRAQGRRLAGGHVTFPGRAYRQGVTTEEAVPWGAETAMNLIGYGPPFAACNALGAAGGKPPPMPPRPKRTRIGNKTYEGD